MQQGGFLSLFRQKTDAGLFFFFKLVTIFFKSCACTIISSDIIQVRPQNLIGKASAHLGDLISSQMYKTYAVEARKLNKHSRKYRSIQREMDARIIKQQIGKFWQISTDLGPLIDVRIWFSLSIFGIPLPIFFKLGMRVDIVKECSGIADG